MQFFHLSGTTTDPELRPLADNVVLNGKLIDLSRDGQELTVQTGTGVKVFALAPGERPSGALGDKLEPFQFPGSEAGKFEAVSPDGKLKATANTLGGVIVEDVSTGATVSRIESEVTSGETGRRIGKVSFSPDSRWLVIWGKAESGNYYDTELYDPGSGRLLYPRFRSRSYDINPAGSAIHEFVGNGQSVQLMTGQKMQLRLANGQMPKGFAEVAEAIVGAYLDERGVFYRSGAAGTRPLSTTNDLRQMIDKLPPKSSWTTFIKARFSSTLGKKLGSAPDPQGHPVEDVHSIRKVNLNELVYQEALKTVRRTWPTESVAYFKNDIIYGDMTQDGNDDAAVTARYRLSGSTSTPVFSQIFVYTWMDAGPVLVTKIDGGDRAHGGIESVKMENGKLLVARFRPTAADCNACYGFVETTTYSWERDHLVSTNVSVRNYEPKSKGR